MTHINSNLIVHLLSQLTFLHELTATRCVVDGLHIHFSSLLQQPSAAVGAAVQRGHVCEKGSAKGVHRRDAGVPK